MYAYRSARRRATAINKACRAGRASPTAINAAIAACRCAGVAPRIFVPVATQADDLEVEATVSPLRSALNRWLIRSGCQRLLLIVVVMMPALMFAPFVTRVVIVIVVKTKSQ